MVCTDWHKCVSCPHAARCVPFHVQGELAAAQEQRSAAAQQHAEAEAARSSLQERLSASEASLAESQQAAQQAQQQHQEATAAAAELREQLVQAQQQVATAAGERQEWAQQRGELQQQVAALQKAQSIADGKLVLARQREAQFKVRRSLHGRACMHTHIYIYRPPPLRCSTGSALLACLWLSAHACGHCSAECMPCPLPRSPTAAGGLQTAAGAAAGAEVVFGRGPRPPPEAGGSRAAVSSEGVRCTALHHQAGAPAVGMQGAGYAGHVSSNTSNTLAPLLDRSCEALEGRCSELERSSHQLEEQLAAAQEEREVLCGRKAALQQQVADAQLAVAQLEQQQQTFQSVQQVGAEMGLSFCLPRL